MPAVGQAGLWQGHPVAIHSQAPDPSKPWISKRGLQQYLHRNNRELQKLGWHLATHWHSDAPLTLEDFQMLWTTHDEEHIQVLLQYAKQQRDLHQEPRPPCFPRMQTSTGPLLPRGFLVQALVSS